MRYWTVMLEPCDTGGKQQAWASGRRGREQGKIKYKRNHHVFLGNPFLFVCTAQQCRHAMRHPLSAERVTRLLEKS